MPVLYILCALNERKTNQRPLQAHNPLDRGPRPALALSDKQHSLRNLTATGLRSNGTGTHERIVVVVESLILCMFQLFYIAYSYIYKFFLLCSLKVMINCFFSFVKKMHVNICSYILSNAAFNFLFSSIIIPSIFYPRSFLFTDYV